jgi:hypothetical protein
MEQAARGRLCSCFMGSLALEQTPAPAQTRRKLDQISPRRDESRTPKRRPIKHVRSFLMLTIYTGKTKSADGELFTPNKQNIKGTGENYFAKEK